MPWAVIKQNKNILMYLLDLMLLEYAALIPRNHILTTSF